MYIIEALPRPDDSPGREHQHVPVNYKTYPAAHIIMSSPEATPSSSDHLTLAALGAATLGHISMPALGDVLVHAEAHATPAPNNTIPLPAHLMPVIRQILGSAYDKNLNRLIIQTEQNIMNAEQSGADKRALQQRLETLDDMHGSCTWLTHEGLVTQKDTVSFTPELYRIDHAPASPYVTAAALRTAHEQQATVIGLQYPLVRNVDHTPRLLHTWRHWAMGVQDAATNAFDIRAVEMAPRSHHENRSRILDEQFH